LITETSWERGKQPQTVLGISKPTSEQGMNIKNARYGCANLHLDLACQCEPWPTVTASSLSLSLSLSHTHTHTHTLLSQLKLQLLLRYRRDLWCVPLKFIIITSSSNWSSSCCWIQWNYWKKPWATVKADATLTTCELFPIQNTSENKSKEPENKLTSSKHN
jgi:hypothetical protein